MKQTTAKNDYGEKVTYIDIDGLQDFADFLKTIPDSKKAFANSQEMSFTELSYKQAIKAMFTGGYTAKVKNMRKVADRLIAAIKKEEPVPQVQFDTTGEFLDIGRVVTGEPENFGYFDQVPAPMKNINIVIQTGYRGAVSGESIINRGSAILAMIDVLKSKNFNVNIHLINTGFLSEHAGTVHFDLKLQTKNRYSNDLLAFVLTSRGFHRRLMFTARQIACNAPGMHFNVGGSTNLPESEITERYGNCIHFGYLSGRDERIFNDEERTIEHLINLIKEQGDY